MFPRKSFLPAFSCALIALCLLTSACSNKEKTVITEQQVSAFLQEMDKASNNKDVDAIVAMMSKDAQFKFTMEGFGPTQILTLNRDQYRDNGKMTFSLVTDYNYRRGETVIKVEPDGQSAYVAHEAFETTTVGSQVIRSVSTGTSLLKMEDGKLVIYKSEAVARPLQPTKKAQPAGF
jgi:ketosteroid isomerase-like protein